MDLTSSGGLTFPLRSKFQDYICSDDFARSLQDLGLTFVNMRDWILILRHDFDLDFGDHPVLAITVLLKPRSGQFVITAFSKVKKVT